MATSNPGLQCFKLHLPDPYQLGYIEDVFNEEGYTFPLLEEFLFLVWDYSTSFSLTAFLQRHPKIKVLRIGAGSGIFNPPPEMLPQLRDFEGSAQDCALMCITGTRPIERVVVTPPPSMNVLDGTLAALAKTTSIRELCLRQGTISHEAPHGYSLRDVVTLNDLFPNLVSLECWLDFEISRSEVCPVFHCAHSIAEVAHVSLESRATLQDYFYTVFAS